MSDVESRLLFVSFCIEQFKVARRLDGDAAAALFRRYGVDAYLYDEYEVLHALGARQLVADIQRFLAVRGCAA